MLIAAAVLILALLLLYCHSEVRRFRLNSMVIKDETVPDALSGRSILLLTDLHCTSFGKDNSRLLNAISACNHDAVIICGDLINGLSEDEFSYAEQFLAALRSMGKPVYYTFGNHELKLISHVSQDCLEAYTAMVGQYCTLLNNSSISVFDEHTVRLHGYMIPAECYHADSESLKEQVDIDAALGTPAEDCYNILIAHDPTLYPFYSDWGAQLTLSGHLHGGIIRLPLVGGVISPRYRLFPKPDRGLFRHGDMNMIISAGLGWHTIPFRFNNLPEMVLISFESFGGKNEFTGQA